MHQSLRSRRSLRFFAASFAFLISSLSLHAANPEADLLYSKAVAERRAGGKDVALEHLQQADSLEPERADILFELGTLAGELSGQRNSIPLAYKARNCLEKVVEKAPTNTAAREWLIGFYSGAPFFAGGSMSKARRHAEVLFTQDEWKGFYWRHRLALQEKEYSEAFSLSDVMLAKAPKGVFARYQLGLTCAASGERLQEGRVALESCLGEPVQANQPGHDQLCLQLGLIIEKQGDKVAAVAAFRRGLEFNPGNKELEQQLSRLQ